MSLLLQGAVFGAVTVAWVAARSDGSLGPAEATRRPSRLAGGAAMLAVAVVGAFVVGPLLPMADANPRYVLRDRVTAPFDPSQYPSPLGRFRTYHGPNPTKEALFTVQGLPQGQVVRFAVMDMYDGYVWRASPPGPGIGGTYRRVGDQIEGAEDGPAATVTFTMGALANGGSVWVPTAGSPTAISFSGPSADRLTDAFRFNRATETAASSKAALAAGDTWEVQANFPPAPTPDDLRTYQQLAVGVSPLVDELAAPAALIAQVAEWTRGKTSPYDRVEAISQKLKTIGGYSDGKTGETPSTSGHYLSRIVGTFLLGPTQKPDPEQPVGNGEQFAAAVAYLAQTLEIPARVVLEFTVPGDAMTAPVDVHAADARAVVEIALDKVGWVAVPDPTPPESQKPTPQAQLPPEPQSNDVVQPPPTTIVPPPERPSEQSGADRDAEEPGAETGQTTGVAGVVARVVGFGSIPLVLLVGPVAIVVWLKARRRRRRRSQGGPSARLAGAWQEVVDLARDLGSAVPSPATRREIARFAALDGAPMLADEIDAAVFGSVEPDLATAETVWASVDGIRYRTLHARSRIGRLRVAANLTSLRGGR
jgi:hypothetical protein